MASNLLKALRRCGMITSIFTAVVVWTILRIVQFVTRLWRIADAEIFQRVGVASAA